MNFLIPMLLINISANSGAALATSKEFTKAAVSEVPPKKRLQMKTTNKNQPPNPFIDKGACPFECCKYREWKVTKETILYEKIASNEIVATVKVGQKVIGVTGEVHIVPKEVKILVDTSGTYKPGTTLFILTNLGEGIFKAWYEGQIKEDGDAYCWETSNCKGKSGTVLKQGSSIWWVHIRLKSGIEGWTKEADNFGNKDACG